MAGLEVASRMQPNRPRRAVPDRFRGSLQLASQPGLGGGGERDSHHTHNLPEKGKGKR